MKNFIFLLGLGLSLLFFGCSDPFEESFRESSNYQPILISRTEATKSISTTTPKETVNTGKFYLYKDHIFLIEEGKGFHVIDNTDRNAPVKKSFVNILNVTDLTAKDNFLFANQSIDLVTLDISDLTDVKFVNRINDIITEVAPDGFIPSERFRRNRPENTIVFRWELIQ